MGFLSYAPQLLTALAILLTAAFFCEGLIRIFRSGFRRFVFKSPAAENLMGKRVILYTFPVMLRLISYGAALSFALPILNIEHVTSLYGALMFRVLSPPALTLSLLLILFFGHIFLPKLIPSRYTKMIRKERLAALRVRLKKMSAQELEALSKVQV